MKGIICVVRGDSERVLSTTLFNSTFSPSLNIIIIDSYSFDSFCDICANYDLEVDQGAIS